MESVESLVELNRQATPEREVRLVVEEEFPGRLSGEESVELLRVLQEALGNARRHSGARNVEVRLGRKTERSWWRSPTTVGDSICLRPGGSGLSAMRERIEGWAARSMSRAGPARERGLWSVFLRGTVLQLLDVYDALPDGVDHRLGPIEEVQLPVDVGGVVVYRLLRDAQ